MRVKIFKRVFTAALIVSIALTLLSCSNSKESSTTQEGSSKASTEQNVEDTTQANQQDTTTTPDEKSAEFVFPQEGVRPFAVMIDNEGTRSLPQGGIDKAQVVYEVIVEGGESRLMPVFWGTDPSMIGPVRSSRHYFLDYAMENDAIYVHFGWSPMAQRDISKLKINNINGVGYGGEIFWDLTKDRNNWQDSYTSMAKIKEFVKKAKYRTETDKPLVYSYNSGDTEVSNGTKAEKISLKYSGAYKCGFEYDAASKTYLRFRKGQPQMERVTNKQMVAKNIIIQMTKSWSIKGDKSGRQEVETVGSGKGWYITDGKAVEIKWSKTARASATKYTLADGTGIKLNPGQTWIQIVPTDGTVNIE